MPRSISRHLLALVPLCAAAGALAGCGQKGPLYLPPPTKPTPAAASSTVKPQQPAVDASHAVLDNQRPDNTQY